MCHSRRLLALFCAATIAAGAASTARLARAAAPSERDVWWRNGVCYEVFVRSFYDSDGDGIGDLKGLIARLDYINDGNPRSTRSLGANCIWLMPIDKATSYHGYDVVDYYHVDPHYGTDNDFRELVREAHRRGIHVIVDFVPNHSSSEHPFFQAALLDPNGRYRGWYRFRSAKPTQLGPWGQPAWHRSPVRDEYYWGVFWHGMPDWNYENPAVLNEMVNVTKYWLTTMHADGFRFDAIPYLVEDGNILQHSRGTHDVLRRFGNEIRARSPQSFTVGEESDMAALPTYYPDQLDSYFEFGVAAGTMEAARTGSAASFIREITRANGLPEGRWAPFLTNHDQPRVMTVVKGDVARARVAASAMLLLPGTPFVYYGEEIGMIGDKPDEQIRTPMQWSAATGGGFSNGKPWEPLQPDWATNNVASQTDDPASLLNHYRRLIHLRHAHVALSRGDMTVGSANNTAVTAYSRHSGGESIFVVVNFGEATARGVTATFSAPLSLTGGRLLYADPGNGCGTVAVGSDGKTLTVASIAAFGLCVYR
ncbi:MAG TPA: alpha-amylase family glycosyl hydrolase [Gemmatimonadaceae bacterium]|nr:alpha-amylase family glycosyl hydrolase [Gemmatimonadaceae bacterium]